MGAHATPRSVIAFLLISSLLATADCAASLEPRASVPELLVTPQEPDSRERVEEETDVTEAPPQDYSEEPAISTERSALLEEPDPDDPTLTAGGALRLFMASRNYRSLRQLKAVMSEALVARYDRNSAPFNGKNRVRLAAFHFSSDDLRPVTVRGQKGSPPGTYIARVRTLWADQGEAVELRREAIRLVRQDSGLWRVSRLEKIESEPLRFRSDLTGQITLRRLMRGWHRRSLASAQRHFGPRFQKRYEGREEDLAALFVGEPDPKHAAYRIAELKEVGDRRLVAKLELFVTSPGQPTPIKGAPVIVQLVRQGPSWLLDAWGD